jgi:AAA family ATP:ADP antiporter
MEPESSPGQRAAVAAATLAAGALIAQQVAGKATRDALFLSTFHVSSLPLVMIASALVSAVAVLAFSAALARRSPTRVVPAALATGTALLLGEWGLCLLLPRLAAVAVYLHMAVFGTVVSGFWSLVNERFDPYTAKRVIGRIALGASLGGVAGGFLVWSAAGLLPVPAMLVLMAALNVACLLALARFRAGTPASAATGGSVMREIGTGPLAGLRLIREVPYLRDLALFVALGAATEVFLDYVLNARAATTFAQGPPLVSFFALFHSGVALLALTLQLTLLRPALRGLGLAGTVALRPAVAAAAALLGIADPRLWSALLARGAYGVLHGSLFRSGYELLFTPLPGRRKRPTKAIVDVGFDKVGTVAAGLVTLLLVSSLGARSIRPLFALAFAGGLVALAIARRLHRGYVVALEDSLRSGVVRLDLADVVDSTTLLTLARTGVVPDREALREIAALRAHDDRQTVPAGDRIAQAVADLRSPEAEVVHRALRRIDTAEGALVGHLIPLLARNDIFLDALRPLRRAATRATGQLLDALLDPAQDLAVRRRIPRVLRGTATQRAADGLLQALSDPDFEVRRQSALTLARITEREASLIVPGTLVFAAALRELEAGSAAWAAGGDGTGADEPSAEAERPQTPAERGLAHVFTLLSLAVDRQPLQISYWALTGQDSALRGTALEYLENVLPPDVRRALWRRLGAHAPAPARRPARQVEQDLIRLGDTHGFSREALKRMSRGR